MGLPDNSLRCFESASSARWNKGRAQQMYGFSMDYDCLKVTGIVIFV